MNQNEQPNSRKSCCMSKMCCPNVGKIDRLLRVTIGTVFVTLTATHQIGPVGWLGLLLIASGFMGFCGMYKIMGINTMCCGNKKDGMEKSGGSCCGGGSSCSTKTDTPPSTP
jgi:hypothetical protein